MKPESVQSAIDAMNAGLPHYKAIRAFQLLAEPLSIENGLLTVNGKPTEEGGREVVVTFMPHLVPMNRGIFSTIYVRDAKASPQDLHAVLLKSYANEPFVHVLPFGAKPSVRRSFQMVSAHPAPSFVTVLKRFGEGDPGLLSFPAAGWTLALDFPARTPGLGLLLDVSDSMFGQRIVDARQAVEQFLFDLLPLGDVTSQDEPQRAVLGMQPGEGQVNGNPALAVPAVQEIAFLGVEGLRCVQRAREVG